MNPIVLIVVPNSISLVFLTLFSIKPDVIVPISNTIIKGNWTLATATALPPNPNGLGLLTMTGIVRYTMKMDIKTSMRIMVGARKLLLVISLKSSKGKRAFLSITIKAASDAPETTKSPATRYTAPSLLPSRRVMPARKAIIVAASDNVPFISIALNFDTLTLSTPIPLSIDAISSIRTNLATISQSAIRQEV